MKRSFRLPERIEWRGDMPADTKRAVESVVYAALERAIASVGGEEGWPAPKNTRIADCVAPAPEVLDPRRYDPSSQTYELPSYDDDGRPTAVKVAPGQSEKAVEPGAKEALRLIAPEWVRESGDRDIFVAQFGNRMVALPATGSVVLLRAPPKGAAQPAGHSPAEQLLALATIAKEGLVAVSVGGRTGFMLDAGGNPAVVFPAAIAAIQRALGVRTFRGIAVSHIHDDHVQSFVRLVLQFQIRPENLHFPSAFTVNAAARGSTFVRQVQAVESDPALRALGHGSAARYGAIPTPAGGAFFRQSLREGQVTFDFFGLTPKFRELETQRQRGQEPRKGLADTASLLTRVTHEQTGTRWLYLGDLRGGDLTLFRQAMGDAAYTEMVSGVRIIVGLQHHLGALDSRADREGLVDLLARTYLRTGQLTVLAQSQETYRGTGQFLNRSLIKALTEAGIDVHVALEPGRGGQVSTLTATTQGITPSGGGGLIESHPGASEMDQHTRRLSRLREAEDVLTKYEQFLTEPGRQSSAVRVARESLEREVLGYIRTLIGNVLTGSAGRQQSTLANPAAQEAALARVRTESPVEAMLTPANMSVLRDLGRIGPSRVIYEQELAAARRTGRMSDRGIDALWELEPQAASRLVGQSGLERVERSRMVSKLPGQPIPAGTRVMGGTLLALAVFQEVAPLLQEAQARSFDENVLAGLNDIIWWQSKGVFPRVQGLNAHAFGKDEWAQDPKRIQELLNAKEIDFLVLLGIDDAGWDAFTIWATTHLLNLPDWSNFILNAKAVRGQSPSVTEGNWEYRKASIVPGTVFGHNVAEHWEKNDRLTKILREAAKRMVATSEKQIAQVATGPGPYGGPALRSPDIHYSEVIYTGKPKASGRKQFKKGLSKPALYTLANQLSIRGVFDAESVFYAFPNSASPDPVPSDYVVVGGADYNTYLSIYWQRNYVRGDAGYDQLVVPNRLEVLLAKSADLRDAP